MRIYPVILCGGSGTRLWPASRGDRPKQFLPLLGPLSLFQNTILRMTGLAGGQAPLVVAGEAHLGFIEAQLAELGIAATVMIEPQGRDSAPAVAAAAAWVAARDPDGVVAMVASDHHIPDAAVFRAAVETAAPAAADGAIVTFGVRPTEPSTAYGYIAPGAALAAIPAILSVARFVEKPDIAAARGYLAAGYLWNSGNFVFGASGLLDELALYAPEVRRVAGQAVAEAAQDGSVVRLSETFKAAPRISIDYAVMEKTARAAVLPVSFAWSDVGAWEAVWTALAKDEAGNAVAGEAVLVDCRDSLIRSTEGRLVVGVGLERIGVIADGNSILVCALGSSQGVKAAVDQLKALGKLDPPALSPELALDDLHARFERWLFASALPLWWSLGADHSLGGFREVLDADARGVAKPLRARVQARQTYAYAVAGLLGWQGPWAPAMDHGLLFMRDRLRRPDGLYRSLLGPDGAVLSETSMAYDQAFVLLALAQVARIAPERAAGLKSEALLTLLALQTAQGHVAGGFFETEGAPFQADPQMHMFEAALAWIDVGGGAAWDALADALAELGLAHLIDPASGAVKENFAEDWTAEVGRGGQVVEPGHQFEWAWLLERWGILRARPDARAAARRLFAVGERGVDRRTGVAVNELLDDFSVTDPSARLWPQTERLKAALILAESEPDAQQRSRYLVSAFQAGEALMSYFEGLVPGLWRDKRLVEGGFVDEPSPASSFYHIVCAFSELRGRRPGAAARGDAG